MGYKNANWKKTNGNAAINPRIVGRILTLIYGVEKGKKAVHELIPASVLLDYPADTILRVTISLTREIL